MTISINITDGDPNSLSRAYGDSMADALRKAKAEAAGMLNQQRPTLYLRDCLGGLRYEARLRDGKITYK